MAMAYVTTGVMNYGVFASNSRLGAFIGHNSIAGIGWLVLNVEKGNRIHGSIVTL